VVKDVTFAIPGALTIPTGGYAYDRRIIEELRASGWEVETLNLGDGFPHPSAALRATAHRQLADQPTDRPLVIDGLAFGVLPDVASGLHLSHRLIALVHHPLALEGGLSPEEADALQASERRALASTHHVIATSAFTARILVSDYGVPSDHVSVVPPGTDRVTPARGSSLRETSLLAVGAVVPRKGYDVLIAALALLRDLPWRLTIVGDRTRDPRTAAQLACELKRLGLDERIIFAGAVSSERLADYYAKSDLFVLASRFEGYGMAFAEAIAHGLPIVGTAAGAIAETVPADARILVPPDDIAALTEALRSVIANPSQRQRMARSALVSVRDFPTWRQSAELFAQAVARAS
jgi:glycosyltransferase involved in cell wall biosynthesis